MKTLMIVDDNLFDLDILKVVIDRAQILDPNGQLLIARNGKEALEIITKFSSEKNNLPQLILLDINMPIMNGFEFLEEVQPLINSKKIPCIPVAMLTSSVSKEDQDQAKHYACVKTFITKPITKKLLKEELAPLAATEY